MRACTWGPAARGGAHIPRPPRLAPAVHQPYDRQVRHSGSPKAGHGAGSTRYIKRPRLRPARRALKRPKWSHGRGVTSRPLLTADELRTNRASSILLASRG